MSHPLLTCDGNIEPDYLNHNSFVYLWYDSHVKMYYIGSHYGDIYDGYKGSGVRFKNAYNKRPNSFERSIIEYCIVDNHGEIKSIEGKYINNISDKDWDRYYNLNRETQSYYEFDKDYLKNRRSYDGVDNPNYGKKHTELSKMKISVNRVGKAKGINNGQFKGEYITPIGIYESVNGTKLTDGEARYCNNNDKILTNRIYHQIKNRLIYINNSHIGLTFKEIGFGIKGKNI